MDAILYGTGGIHFCVPRNGGLATMSQVKNHACMRAFIWRIVVMSIFWD